MQEFVFLNNDIVPSETATVSVHDSGLLHGIGLFETMRSYNGTVFRLDDHLDRLFASAAALELNITQSRESITDGVAQVIQANNITDGRIRLTATAGSLKHITPDNPPTSTLLITAAPMVAYPPELYKYGMITTVATSKQNPEDPLTGHKTINYFPRLLALQKAQMMKTGESLWFTTQNYLAEGCISNVFLVSDGQLFTPPVDTPVLPGIARKVVIELAKENGITCNEHELNIKDVLQADEIFLTNSIMELMPVRQVEAHTVGTGEPGDIYKKLHDLYRQAVEDECGTTEE